MQLNDSLIEYLNCKRNPFFPFVALVYPLTIFCSLFLYSNIYAKKLSKYMRKENKMSVEP